jgi:hypothetical protein
MSLPIAQTPYFDLWQAMRNAMPQIPTGVSDELGAAYLSSAGSLYGSSLNNATQIALQDQANRIRMMELMGADATGAQTDAANRWRSELQAQQAVQNERLRQEQMQILGYNPTAGSQTTMAERAARQQAAQRWAELTGQVMDPEGRQSGTTLSAQAQQAEIARRQAELLGTDAQGRQTMEAQRLAQEARDAAAQRNLQLQLQQGQLTQQEYEFARNHLLQQQASAREQAALSGVLDNGQLTEEARAQRAQEALQGAATFGMGANGQMTEAARAAREGERSQRARDAADLTRSSRDVFRASNYFREMQNDPTGLGIGGGQLGFSSQAMRSLGTPGTISMGDVEQASNPENQYRIMLESGGRPSPGYPQPTMPQMTTNGPVNRIGLAPTGMSPTGATTNFSLDAQPQNKMGIAGMLGTQTGTGSTGAVTNFMTEGPESLKMGGSAPSGGYMGSEYMTMGPESLANQSAAPSTTDEDLDLSGYTSQKGTTGTAPGMSPGGPVGMGAGGSFVGRKDPRVREFAKQLADMSKGAKGVVGKQRNVRDKAGKLSKSAEGALEADKRADRGLIAMRKQLMQNMLGGGVPAAPMPPGPPMIPGMQPGGPVDAPLWPTAQQGSVAMPQIQAQGSLGAPAQTSGGPSLGSIVPQQPAPPAPFAQADVAGNDQRLGNFAQQLQQYGIQGFGPQMMEQAGATGRGVLEGAFEALGLNPEDAAEAYAMTRFANSGNALMA